MSVRRGFALHATRRSAPVAHAGAKGARGGSTSHSARGPWRDRLGIDDQASASGRRRQGAWVTDQVAEAAVRGTGIDGQANRRLQPTAESGRLDNRNGGGEMRKPP